MPTAFAALSQALAARLLEAPQIVDDHVFRDRIAPLPREVQRAVNVRQTETIGNRAGVGSASPIDWSTDFAIEIYARAAADQVPGDALDPQLQAVFERLAGWLPVGLAVQEVVVEPRIEWESFEGQTPLICARLLVRIVHRTAAAALTVWP